MGIIRHIIMGKGEEEEEERLGERKHMPRTPCGIATTTTTTTTSAPTI